VWWLAAAAAPPWGGLQHASRHRQGVAGAPQGGTAGPRGGGAVCVVVRQLTPMQVGSLLVASSASLAVGVEV
jgi:hypothetical protein